MLCRDIQSNLSQIQIGSDSCSRRDPGRTKYIIRYLLCKLSCGKVIETDQEAADAVTAFLEMDKTEIQSRCRESIVRFSFDNYIAQIEAVFDEVLSD